MSNIVDIRKIKKNVKTPRGTSGGKNGEGKGIWEFLNKDINLGVSIINDRVKENFYLELSTLLEAGVDIRTILEMLRDEQKNKKRKSVFNKLLEQIVSGASLSAALHSSGKFSKYEYFSVLIGEESGKLVQVLKDMAFYYQKKIKQRRQVIGALTYPLVVLTVAFLAISFMVGYVVPMFSDVFKRFGSDLPPITKAVIEGSSIFKRFLKYFILFLVFAIVAGYRQRNKNWFRDISSRIMLSIPVIGSIVHKIYLSRFANTMALLNSSKVPLLQALQMTRQMIGFYPIEASLYAIEEKVMNGIPFHKSMEEHPIYPLKMITLVKVGEQVNQLELFFTRISEQYGNEVEHQTGMLSKLLEPLIIVVLGFVVGLILIAMYLPMFRLGQPL